MQRRLNVGSFPRPHALLCMLVMCALSLQSACAVPPSAGRDHADDSETGTVTVMTTDSGWALRRNGRPYFIKGAGGHEHLDKLVGYGGNSIRTWGADNLHDLLDKAHALNLTVTIGIWIGHERHGFNYDDPAMVRQQFDEAKAYVEQYKDHPALLVWGIGNEMEGDGANPRIWKAINDIARMIKQVDPNHPTMTVVAEITPFKIEQFRKFCPDVDILGINSYGGLPSLAQRAEEAGLDRPYIVTEFGPLGQWEVGHTPWGVPIEQTSTEKARFCEEGYKQSILDQPKCLGGYVFNWGTKQEVTDTWYSLFIAPWYDSTEIVDVMSRFWTGHWPENRAPAIQEVRLNMEDSSKVRPGTSHTAIVKAQDPDGDSLSYHWLVRSETTDRRLGGDREQAPPDHPECVTINGQPQATFTAPTEPGPYRLFVTIRDGKGHAGTANLPFFVSP